MAAGGVVTAGSIANSSRNLASPRHSCADTVFAVRSESHTDLQLIGPRQRLAVDREQDIPGRDVDVDERARAIEQLDQLPADEPLAGHPRRDLELAQERGRARVEHRDQPVARDRAACAAPCPGAPRAAAPRRPPPRP